MNFGSKPKQTEAFEVKFDDPNLNAMTFKLNQNYSQPVINERYSGRGYMFYGQDNMYPEYLKKMYAGSSLHASLINFKKIMTVGNGFVIDTTKLKGMELIEANQILNQFDGEKSLNKILDKISLNYWMYGSVYIKVTWNADNTKIIKREVISGDSIRLGEHDKFGKVTSYYYCFDWTQTGRYPIVKLPAYDKENTKEKAQIYAFILDTPITKFYSAPVYQTAGNWIMLDAEIGNYHKSNIFNSINPSFALKFYKKPGSPEERDMILRGIEENFAGSSNTGRAMVFFSDGKETAPDIEPINVSNIDKQFQVTADAIQRNILYAHGISPILMGFKTPGSLGSGQELPIAYEIANNSVIKPAQKDIEEIINNIFQLNGITVDFKLKSVDLFTITPNLTA